MEPKSASRLTIHFFADVVGEKAWKSIAAPSTFNLGVLDLFVHAQPAPEFYMLAEVGFEPTVQDYEFCPITLVAAWLGYGWSSVGAYDAAGSRMGLDHETRENIIQAADIKLPDEDYCHDEGDYNRRATLESACVPTPFIPEGWQFVD